MDSRKEFYSTILKLKNDIETLDKNLKDRDTPKIWCLSQNGKKNLVLGEVHNGSQHRKTLHLFDSQTDEILLTLIRKHCYDRKVANLQRLEKFASDLIPDDLEEAVNWLLQKYPPLTRDYLATILFNNEITNSPNAQQAEKHGNDKFGNKNNVAVTGQKVRSKSEALIIERLEHYGIMYQYEHNFKINGKEISPDFFLVSKSGDFFIWEHLGLMDNPRYMKHQKYKFQEYLKVGFAPWKNMIITYDGPGGIIDMEEIDFRIKQKLL